MRNRIGWRGALTLVALASALATVAVWATRRGDDRSEARPPAAVDADMRASDPHAGHARGAGPGTDDMDGMTMDGMDMDADGLITLDPAMARSLGVTLATVELGPLRREIRTTGHVTFDETRLSMVTPKIGGFIERLHVNFTGQSVTRGQPLLEIYSPELVAAQEELLAAVRLERQLARSAAPGVAERTGGLVDAARRRLALWDISAAQIRRVEETGVVTRAMTLYAPFTGFVVEKSVQAGQAVQPGQPLYRLADLSQVWVEADVYERDLDLVRTGEPARVAIDALPGEVLTGRISYVYPDVRRETRTGRVRIQLPNPGGRVKPGMFATVYLDAPGADRALLVPRDAVMRTGTRDIVFVEHHPGAYEARQVTAGAASGGQVQILEGLREGERVVARANFILDAESRLMETMRRQPDMPGMEH